MVWNQAPIWQRDRRDNILREPLQRRRAWETVRRTVIAARSHPSVITHSVANELWSRPDDRPGVTRRYLESAARDARELDPTLPISVDINGRPYHPEQFTYHAFDMLGINQYFGWYSWVSDFNLLPLFLQEMRDLYPRARARDDGVRSRGAAGAGRRPGRPQGLLRLPELPPRPHPRRGRRRPHLRGDLLDPARVRDLPRLDRRRGRRPPPYQPNTRHQKGLLTYEGEKKPAWFRARERFGATPLYR